MKKKILFCLFVVFAGIFLTTATLLIKYYVTSAREQNQFRDLAQLVENVRQELPEVSQPAGESTPEETTGVQEAEADREAQILPQYAQVYEMNPDMVGWMVLEGTVIDYPVMQTPDRKDYYLKRDFQKNYSARGCLYVQEEADVFAPSDNMTIYGHRMNDGSMFGALSGYTKKSFYEAHPRIRFDTLTQERTYQIIAVFRTTADWDEGFAYHRFVDGEDEADFNRYVDTCMALSLYDTGYTAVYGDKLITLSTCEYTRANGRLVVVAKQVEETT